MKYSEQLSNLFELQHVPPKTTRPYIKERCPEAYQEMFESLQELAQEPEMNCCAHHRALVMMKLWCGGMSVFIRAYQMYGIPEDVREVMVEIGPLGDQDE